MKLFRACYSLAIMSIVMLAISCNGDNSKPILAHGLIKSENEDYTAKTGCYAVIEMVNTSNDKIVAECKVTDIAYLPKYYEIRQDYYQTFDDYWSEYVIRCRFYESGDDTEPSQQCEQKIDITNYDRNIDLIVK